MKNSKEKIKKIAHYTYRILFLVNIWFFISLFSASIISLSRLFSFIIEYPFILIASHLPILSKIHEYTSYITSPILWIIDRPLSIVTSPIWLLTDIIPFFQTGLSPVLCCIALICIIAQFCRF